MFAYSIKEPFDNELNSKINMLKEQFKDKEMQLIKDGNNIYVKVLLDENETKCFVLKN